MTLLEVIIKSKTHPNLQQQSPITTAPITLNYDPITTTTPSSFSLLQPVSPGLNITQLDTHLIDANSKFFNKLKRKLKDPQSLSLSFFSQLLNGFLLDNIGRIMGPCDFGDVGSDDTCKLMAKFGSFVGKDVMGLVIEGCFMLGYWGLLETLIVNDLVDHGFCSDFLFNLVSKSRSDLICLCVRHFADLNSLDLCRVFKYFLGPPSKDASLSMGAVRKQWETEALATIDKAKSSSSFMNKELAKEVSILLMLAYDEFSSSELCLHFLISSNVVDDVVFSSAVSKLNGDELLGLIKYLGKWLSKYERFPQAGPICSKATITSLELNLGQWVRKLEDVVKCLGLVVDEHFSSLALRLEFHKEFKAIEGVVSSLASMGRLCCSVTNLIQVLNPEVRGA